MFEELQTIENIQTKIHDNIIIVENGNSQKTKIIRDNVKSTEIVFSSIGDKGFKITFNSNDFLIITTNDFILKTLNFGLLQVQNLPEIISLNEVIDSVRKYLENPEPNNNIDNTLALYLLNKTLLENAEYYNFDVAYLKNKVRKAALNTNSIGDITLYD